MINKKILMIGYPVSSVRTTPLLNDWFLRNDYQLVVETREIFPNKLNSFLSEFIENEAIAGLCVTMPFKQKLKAIIDLPSETVRVTNSTNCIRKGTDNLFEAEQFDGAAVVASILKNKVDLGTSTVLVAGLGGSGSAIVHAIATHGCKTIIISETNAEKLDHWLTYARKNYTTEITSIVDNNLSPEIVVNATPVGMESESNTPFSINFCKHAQLIVDIVADPPKTGLMSFATMNKKEIITGRDIVLSQVDLIGPWLANPLK